MSGATFVTSTPIAYVTAERSQKSGIWILSIASCPFCQRKHSHGGGDDSRPDFGYRLSHCIDRPSETYELVPTAESGWAA